jgi:hypothetical protein
MLSVLADGERRLGPDTTPASLIAETSTWKDAWPIVEPSTSPYLLREERCQYTLVSRGQCHVGDRPPPSLLLDHGIFFTKVARNKRTVYTVSPSVTWRERRALKPH